MKKGFTLIEVIIAVGITVLLASTAVAGFTTFNQNQQVKQAALTLKTNLRLAQAKAMSGQKPNTEEVACTRVLSYTVSFVSSPNSGYTVSANCSEGDVPVTTVNLPQTVWFSPLPSSIRFETVTGRISTAATISLLGTHSGYDLNISPSGQISDDGFVAITPTPASTPQTTPTPTTIPIATPTPPIVPSPTPTSKTPTPTSTPANTPTPTSPPIVPSPTPTTAPGYSCANGCTRPVTGGPYATQNACQIACGTN